MKLTHRDSFGCPRLNGDGARDDTYGNPTLSTDTRGGSVRPWPRHTGVGTGRGGVIGSPSPTTLPLAVSSLPITGRRTRRQGRTGIRLGCQIQKARMFAGRNLLGDEDVEAATSSGYINDIERAISPTGAPLETMAGGINNEDVIEIDKWASSIARMLDDVPHYMCSPGHPGRISRIPECLREVDIKAYEPLFVSIGPYHHNSPRVQNMEKRKWAVLKCFLEQKPELTVKDYLFELMSIEPIARSFYSDVNMDNKAFLQMLLLDSMLILLIFCGMPENHLADARAGRVDNSDMNEIEIEKNEDTETENRNMNTETMAKEDESNEETASGENTEDGQKLVWTMLPHDLFLLENQLPFFVLQKMYSLAYGGSETQLMANLKGKMGMLLADYVKLESEMIILDTEEVHHILHLCHMFFRPRLQNHSSNFQLPYSSQMFRLDSAMQLYEAGVSFKATSQHSLLDVTFSRTGKMTMPCLHVDEQINSLLRNLIALEQMKYPSLGLHVSAYIVFLLHLITTPEDVQLLSRKGILQHHLPSDKEMMRFVNKLSVGLSFDYVEDKYSLKPLFHELKTYSERRKPRWKAWLKHRYFNNPWMMISLLAASLLLFMSALQTYYTVYSYYHPYFHGHS